MVVNQWSKFFELSLTGWYQRIIVVILRQFKITPIMKLILNDKWVYLTIELPIKGPNMAHGNVTRSKTAWAVPLCLLGTSSPIAASLELKWEDITGENYEYTYASCWLPDPIPLNIIPVMTIGTFLAARAMIVPVRDMQQPTMKNPFRPNISDRPPDRGRETDTAMV